MILAKPSPNTRTTGMLAANTMGAMIQKCGKIDDTDAFTLTVVDRSISWLSVVLFGGLLFVGWQYFSNGRGDESVAPEELSPSPDEATKAPVENQDSVSSVT